MTYCRWSSDDWQCDIFCGKNNGGYKIDVALNRPVFYEPLPPKVVYSEATAYEYFAREAKARMIALFSGRERIGLPYDGVVFQEPDLPSVKGRLLMLREAGYRFPDYVLEAIECEMREGVG